MRIDDNANSAQIEPPKERISSPPYISFLTFKNMIDWLERENIPLRFDRSFWQKKYSGSVGPQLMAGLRFLGLLKGDMPQPDLDQLVEAKGGDERKAKLADILQRTYTAINFGELPRATPSLLTEWFRSYNLEGDTLRKAESFFINACKYADVPLSNAIRKKARNKPPKANLGVSKDRRKNVRSGEISPPSGKIAEPPEPLGQKQGEQGNLARIALNSGGEVTLGLSVDLFNLNENDREFVFKLIDLVRNYQKTEQEGNEKRSG
jgi:hypothetical protein